MTDFVETFATQQLLPPWQAKGALISGFVIRLQPNLIQSYLDKYFNAAYPDYAPFRYEPLPLEQQYGLLTASVYPVIRTTTRDPASGGQIWDNISHTEIYLAFPVYRRTVNADGLLSEPTLVWVQPAVYSDNDTVVFSSREIWGTDMFLATIEQDSSTPAFHLDAGLVAIKHFDPRSVDKLLAFLHIHAMPTPELDLPAILQANPSLQEFVNILGAAGMFSGDSPPPGVQTGAYPAGVELNNVKQFRDCYDMGVAIYRAIVASQASYTNVGDIVFYDTPGIDIAFMWSDSLAEFLQTILGADRPSMDITGPPPVHSEDWTSQMDWDMDRVVVKADLGFAFVADVDFRVLSTLHTYGTTA
jgi:hypothetical protein